jgi:hypothetical protein
MSQVGASELPNGASKGTEIRKTKPSIGYNKYKMGVADT